MKPTARLTVAAVAAGAATLATAVPLHAEPPERAATSLGTVDPPRHEVTVESQPLRGATFVCGDLTLRVTRGRSVETQDGDLRDGVANLYISRIWRHVRLHGSDGHTYRASGVSAAWFVLHSPDFETPVRGLEINQVMFRGGPDLSPGWIRERIAWSHGRESESVHGPCTFGD